MRIVQSFYVARPQELVFGYASDPSKLGRWQTSNRSVEQITPGPVGVGSRFRERTRPPGMREFEQITEFAEFDRPRRFRVHVVEGPQLIDGAWNFESVGDGTRVTFAADGALRGAVRFVEPLVRWVLARRFATYHRNLRLNLETGE